MRHFRAAGPKFQRDSRVIALHALQEILKIVKKNYRSARNAPGMPGMKIQHPVWLENAPFAVPSSDCWLWKIRLASGEEVAHAADSREIKAACTFIS
jgi:hypothetical protein